MKYHPCFPTILDLNDTQKTLLHSKRNPLHVLRAQWEAKVDKALHYFQRYNLSGAVVGVSGGIDSALALAFLKAMHERSPGTLRKIAPLLLPIYEDDAATGQRQATGTQHARRFIQAERQPRVTALHRLQGHGHKPYQVSPQQPQ